MKGVAIFYMGFIVFDTSEFIMCVFNKKNILIYMCMFLCGLKFLWMNFMRKNITAHVYIYTL